MKNFRMFFGLVAVITSTSLVAAEKNNVEPADSVEVERVVFEEVTPAIIDGARNKKQPRLEDLLDNCYKGGDIEACRQFISVALALGMAERAGFQLIISSQQKTITTHEETISNFNELEKRRSARIAKRKEARKVAQKTSAENVGNC